MNKSINSRLFRGIAFIIMFFIAFTWLLNSSFLKVYYQNEKRNILLDNSSKIESLYKGDPSELTLELERIENKIGANILIRDKKGVIIYSSFSRIINQRPVNKKIGIDLPWDERKSNPPLKPFDKIRSSQLIKDKYYFQIQYDPELKVNFLVLETILANGDMLMLRSPMAAITESVGVANKFLLFTGLLSIVIGSVWAYFFARKFTKPILELNKVAQNMATFDFSRKYEITSEDEISELGKSINYLSNQLDMTISELKEKNKMLEQDIERERKIDEMRKEFISSVSHELKTPISLIQGYSEGLKLNVNEDEENKNFYCDVVIDEANRMDKIVKDLLNLSQIESGFFKLEKTIFDLAELLNQVINKYKVVFYEKKISLLYEVGFNQNVNADRTRIEQILFNFINNAINHVDERYQIQIKVYEQDTKYRVGVYNSGKPIPEDALDKIWDSFYKVDKARTRVYGGTGLGLSIVKAIQDLHRNSYGVINREEGVEFWFEIDK